MKKTLPIFLTFFLFLALAACGPVNGPQTTAAPEPAASASETEAPAGTTPEETHLQPEEGWQVITIEGVEMLWDGYKVKEPDIRLDIDSMCFADFGEDFFTESYPVETERYTLCEGEIMETEVVHIKAEVPGPVLYIVAGVHGDEIAAWYAGRLLRSATLKAGELYIVAPANANGAKNRTRYVTGTQDMNRSFPGSPDGNEAERIANAIYRDIERVQPFLVFDLHEAIVYTEGRDFLGSNLIYTILDNIDDLFFDMLFATQDGDLCSNAFSSNGPGPKGSINNTVANELGIPVITVETFRGFPIERRVSDQLAIVQYALEYVEMR
ncbi:MAG: succinylglutamate desuccinylase/aspartoacylase family protein [Lachnospiraceae bacterium]|nr:succinylglutamate desuccinylase/aspartoacylase family protein [Lachnospiraceae bacterium]